MRKSIKNLTLAVIALGALSMTACMSSGSSNGPGSEENATIFVRGKMKNVNTLSKPGLAKLTPITLTTLRITAVSDKVGVKVLGEDSVVVEYSVGDTLTEDDDTLSHVATDEQEFDVELSLRPLRSWTIKVETIDDEDDVIQTGTSNLGTLFAGQVKAVSVTANALYNNYTATFNFADSIRSQTGTISRQDMKVTTITMQIGTDSVFDTAAVRANGMTVNTNHLLNIYKVDTALANSDQDSVYLNVYGFLPQGPANGGTAAAPIKLYSKAKALDELNVNSPTTVTLDWVGPTTGVAGMTITISKVGTVEITVETDPEVIE
jgi:hypothetical protein